jgi:hypothetical protein
MEQPLEVCSFNSSLFIGIMEQVVSAIVVVDSVSLTQAASKSRICISDIDND